MANSVMRPSSIRWPLFILLGIVLYHAYSWNFSRRFAEIEAKTTFLDQTGTWNDENKQAYYEWSRRFREQWGIKLLVHIRQDALTTPKLKPNTIFIGLQPASGESSIILPPLVAKALETESQEQSTDIRQELNRNMVLCLQTEKSSVPCVMDTINHISKVFTAE